MKNWMWFAAIGLALIIGWYANEYATAKKAEKDAKDAADALAAIAAGAAASAAGAAAGNAPSGDDNLVKGKKSNY